MSYELSILKSNVKEGNYIKDVVKGSIAYDMGIKKGYKLISINDEKIIDILDYKFLTADEYLEIDFEDLDGNVVTFEVEKDYDEDLGLIFESELIDKPRNCRNNCIFCFMNQLPKHVRETLIFKDDDYRLSFFSGNYVTTTNMNEKDFDRIIKYRLSPINISVHATDPEVRCKMLNNRFAGNILDNIKRLYDAGIYVNTQIVLCRGINDGKILEKSIKDLSKFYPYVRCIGIVPVGLTKHREKLSPLKTLTKEDCIDAINIVSKYNKEFKAKWNDNLVYLADEFYLKAEVKVPSYEYYGEFDNIENGIGMISDFNHELSRELKRFDKKLSILKEENKLKEKTGVLLLTGKITEKFMKEKCDEINIVLNRYGVNIDFKVISVKNTFFGEEITVTGLITGNDIINTLNNNEINDTNIFLPRICLKEDEDIFLDDVTLKEVKDKFKNIYVVKNEPKDLLKNVIKVIKK